MNPLELPELRAHISRYISPSTASICARVSKDWSKDFAPQVWHTLDFQMFDNKDAPDVKVFNKYGHHIRVVKHLQTAFKMSLLQSSSVSNLESLDLIMDSSEDCARYASFVLAHNHACLKSVGIIGSFQAGERMIAYSFSHIVGLGLGVPIFSRLTHMQLHGLGMVRETFSCMLADCPVLEHLEIHDTIMIDGVISHIHQTPSVKTLCADLRQVFYMDPDDVTQVPLLAHFPNLKKYDTGSFEHLEPFTTYEMMQYYVDKFSPQVMSLRALSTASHGLLMEVFKDLTEICVSYENVYFPDIFHHYETLQVVRMYKKSEDCYERDSYFDLEDIRAEEGAMVHVMAYRCHGLKVLDMPLHIADIRGPEVLPWGCAGLEELHMRFMSLDTPEKINHTLQMWVERRKLIPSAVGDTDSSQGRVQINGWGTQIRAFSKESEPIEERVVRHLLRFRNLRK
ncbi:hypothetical protein BGZ54_000089, partial [Gamsiella multidivaricata]